MSGSLTDLAGHRSGSLSRRVPPPWAARSRRQAWLPGYQNTSRVLKHQSLLSGVSGSLTDLAGHRSGSLSRRVPPPWAARSRRQAWLPGYPNTSRVLKHQSPLSGVSGSLTDLAGHREVVRRLGEFLHLGVTVRAGNPSAPSRRACSHRLPDCHPRLPWSPFIIHHCECYIFLAIL